MINLHSSNLEVKHIKLLIQSKIKDTYIDKYINKPAIDIHKLIILSNIISQTNLTKYQKENYIITTMLVQIALDTHDLVSADNNQTESKFRRTSRQLTVLAGDYYSGLYYLTLSKTEDIHLIRVLATTIKEINELKIKRYYKEVNSFEEFIKIEQKIESLLIIRVSEFLKFSTLNDMYENIMILNKLVQEKKNLRNQDRTPFLENWITSTTQNTYMAILNKIDSIIDEKFEMIQKDLAYLPATLTNNIHPMINELKSLNNIVSEEG